MQSTFAVVIQFRYYGQIVENASAASDSGGMQ